ncbi:kinase binding protein CGI-121-domain-containing protein [Lipomyces arxii]|uniref:kinase binding protein CGI-121-domain-containing protein n=1 Tax=Lipomyces arxii TaxID=56418 RepID=UPI0034CD9759
MVSGTELTLSLPQFPSSTIYISLYTGITNASTIRTELLGGNTKYAYAFVDPRTILSLTHLLSSVYRALTDNSADLLRTRTLHSELVFDLSPNMNIADSLRRFGLKDDSDSVLVLKVDDAADAKSDERKQRTFAAMDEIVEGTRVAVSDTEIAKLTDLELVRKNYKVSQGISLTDTGYATTVVTGAVALRGYF